MVQAPGHNLRAILLAVRSMAAWKKAVVGGTSLSFLIVVLVERYLLQRFAKQSEKIHTEDDAKVTVSFWRNFFQMSRLALPTWRCREFVGSVIFIVLFAVKSVLRVWVSKMNAQVLGTIIHGRPAKRLHRFVQSILLRWGVGLSAALCSGAIEGLRPWLIGCYRVRLSRVFQRRFFDMLVYYQATVLDDRLEEADTIIASYCAEFAEHFAELPYYFLLPGFECLTSGLALAQQSGWRSTSLMGGVVVASVLMLRALAPTFGRIHALLLAREDNYRRMMTSAINNVESVAMQNAGSYTDRRLEQLLGKLKITLDNNALARGNFELLEVAFSAFLTVVANTVTFAGSHKANYHRSVNDVYLEMQYVNDLNNSVKDFVVNFRELSHLAEYTDTLAEFDNDLRSIASGTFIRHQPPTMGKGSAEDSTTDSKAVVMGSPVTGKPLEYVNITHMEHAPQQKQFPFVSMEDVYLRSPAGQILFDGLTLDFEQDQDWVIVGENGSGKTSLLRMITGLWLPRSGRLSLDKSVHFLMAPQHSYMAPQCTLYEQLYFPRPVEQPNETIIANIKKAIQLSGAESVIKVIGGYHSEIMGLDFDRVDTSYEWTSLSGGQKQRISMARIFFFVLSVDREKVMPVALLDEATSMMDDTEQEVLNNMRRQNVRMISVTHREVVIRHHTHMLRLEGSGKWSATAVPDRVKVGERVVTTGTGGGDSV